jgi:hypothetical protein
MRLISLTCVPSNPTRNIWRHEVDRGTLGRGEALRFVLVNSWHRGSTMRNFWWAYSSCLKHRHSQQRTTTILSTWLNNKKSGARRRSWALDSRTRSATHDDDRLRLPSEPQELSDHVSSGGQATSYNRFNRWSDTTTDRGSIDDYLIFRVSPWWDVNNEAQRISMVERSNQEPINSSSKGPANNESTMTKCSFS